MLANPRRTIVSFAPFFAILASAVLNFTGVLSVQVYFVIVTGATFYMLGQLSVIVSDNEVQRRASIAHLEGFIVHMHGVLEDDELSDENRRSAETALSAATAALDNLERSASPWTRRRERRAREKAAQ